MRSEAHRNKSADRRNWAGRAIAGRLRGASGFGSGACRANDPDGTVEPPRGVNGSLRQYGAVSWAVGKLADGGGNWVRLTGSIVITCFWYQHQLLSKTIPPVNRNKRRSSIRRRNHPFLRGCPILARTKKLDRSVVSRLHTRSGHLL